MKQSETKIISKRQFASEVEEFVEENKPLVKRIVEESDWHKKRTQTTTNHTSILQALNI
jgi:hypothetical protein